jgi:hypothetical protein
MKDMKNIGIVSSNSLSVCTSHQSEDISECIKNSSKAFDVGTLVNKCQNYGFRQSSQNPDFGKCIVKIQRDAISKADAIDMCSVSDDELDQLVNSRRFDTCMSQDFKVEIPKRDRYSICADKKITNLLADHSYKKCLKTGFSSGIMNYFSLKSSEANTQTVFQGSQYNTQQRYSNIDNITPWSYVFKDCAGDYKYRNKSKKFNSYLKVYKDYNIHTDAIFETENLNIGGLSAVRFDEESNKAYFLSDDRGFNTNASPRIYTYDYLFNKNGDLELSESHIISLSRKNKSTSAKTDENEVQKGQSPLNKSSHMTQMDMDPEGFDFTESGNIIISSELDDLMANDFLSIFTPDGNAFETIALNDDFKPTTTKKTSCHQKKRHRSRNNNSNWGINVGFSRNNDIENNTENEDEDEDDTYEVCNTTYTQKGFLPNKSLESLSLTPNKKHMFTANESSLYQDSNQNDRGRLGKRVRIIRYAADFNGKFKEEKQYYYRLENKADNGLVEILSLNKDSILTLERSWDNVAKKITSRIYLVNLTNAQNILDAHKKSISRVRSVKKQLIIDLDTIKYELSPGFRKIDNIEGMSFGPTLPNGKKSIVLVSDNNFRSSQRSMIVILELNLKKLLKLTK